MESKPCRCHGKCSGPDCCGWKLKWIHPSQETQVRVAVPGPFNRVKLIKAQPYTSTCNECCGEDDCKPRSRLRTGIPDPWLEYLAWREDKSSKSEHDVRLCQEYLRLTKFIWGNMGIPLTQGIPDPWKIGAKLSLERLESLDKRKKKHVREKKLSERKTQIKACDANKVDKNIIEPLTLNKPTSKFSEVDRIIKILEDLDNELKFKKNCIQPESPKISKLSANTLKEKKQVIRKNNNIVNENKKKIDLNKSNSHYLKLKKKPKEICTNFTDTSCICTPKIRPYSKETDELQCSSHVGSKIYKKPGQLILNFEDFLTIYKMDPGEPIVIREEISDFECDFEDPCINNLAIRKKKSKKASVCYKSDRRRKNNYKHYNQKCSALPEKTKCNLVTHRSKVNTEKLKSELIKALPVEEQRLRPCRGKCGRLCSGPNDGCTFEGPCGCDPGDPRPQKPAPNKKCNKYPDPALELLSNYGKQSTSKEPLLRVSNAWTVEWEDEQNKEYPGEDLTQTTLRTEDVGDANPMQTGVKKKAKIKKIPKKGREEGGADFNRCKLTDEPLAIVSFSDDNQDSYYSHF